MLTCKIDVTLYVYVFLYKIQTLKKFNSCVWNTLTFLHNFGEEKQEREASHQRWKNRSGTCAFKPNGISQY